MEERKRATENFSPSRLVGKGGFGDVFGGVMRATKVAVKCLSPEGGAQLKPEVTAVTRYHNVMCKALILFW